MILRSPGGLPRRSDACHAVSGFSLRRWLAAAHVRDFSKSLKVQEAGLRVVAVRARKLSARRPLLCRLSGCQVLSLGRTATSAEVGVCRLASHARPAIPPSTWERRWRTPVRCTPWLTWYVPRGSSLRVVTAAGKLLAVSPDPCQLRGSPFFLNCRRAFLFPGFTLRLRVRRHLADGFKLQPSRSCILPS